MTDHEDELNIQERLVLALESGHLPAGGPAEAAERLVDRLGRPVRLAIMGLPGSGKTSIMNLLAGGKVIPDGLRLPTMLVRNSREERTVCTFADGTSEVFAGRAVADALRRSPALITLELNLPALSVINLMEVAAGPAEADQRRAMAWVVKRADFVMWCSPAFLSKEQALWEEVPDSVKDNGFLLVTKTDLLGEPEVIRTVVHSIETRAGEEFRQILPISTLKARQAIGPDGSVNRALFRESGAATVISAIKARVDSARRSDMDTAELLLERHRAETKRPTRAPPAPESMLPLLTLSRPAPPSMAPADEAPVSAARQPARTISAPPNFAVKTREIVVGAPPRAVPPISVPPKPGPARPAPFSVGPPVYAPPAYKPPAPPPRTMASSDMRPLRPVPPEPAGAERPKPRPLLLVPKAEPPPEKPVPRVVTMQNLAVVTPVREAISKADREIVEAALETMMDRAVEVAIRISESEKLPVEMILEHGLVTADLVADALSNSNAPQIRRIAFDLNEVQDLMMLMQTEKGRGPADDTLTLLLQIRRDLETILAS